MRKNFAVATAVALATAAIAASPVAANAAKPTRWDNCTRFNHVYPHGVGRIHAHDHTSGTPVRNFKHSNRLYRIAMRHNSGLDRDKDHVACEKG